MPVLQSRSAGSSDNRTAMLAQRRILLVTDVAKVARPVSARRDRTKVSVLRKYFTPVADAQVRGRRVTVCQRVERP